MLGDRLRGDPFDRLSQRRLVVGHAVEQGANGIGDLLAAAIGDGDIELEAVIRSGRTLGSRNRGENRLGQHRSAADGAHSHAPPVNRRITRQSLQLGFDGAEDPGDFRRWPAKIVGRKDPQGHRRNAQLDAPVENLVELVGAEIVKLPRLGDPERAAVPAIAVENDADMARGRPTLDVADEPTGIEVVKQAEHRRQRSFPPQRKITGTAVAPTSRHPNVNEPKIWRAGDEDPDLTCEQSGPHPCVAGLCSMAVARSLRLIAQADRSDAGRDVEPGIAFDADRLQRDRAVGAADQHIGAGPDADSGAAGGADIIAVERTGAQISGRREYRPNQHAALRIADIDAELVDRAGIELGTPRAGAKVQRSAFDEPKTKPQPLATWQVSVPTRTPPCACAAVDTPAARPTKPIAKHSFLNISSALFAASAFVNNPYRSPRPPQSIDTGGGFVEDGAPLGFRQRSLVDNPPPLGAADWKRVVGAEHHFVRAGATAKENATPSDRTTRFR